MQFPAHAESIHVSKNHLEGSLCDTPFDRLLRECERHLVTGTIRVTALGRVGMIELRAGAVESAAFDGASGERALDRMRALRDGMYDLWQRLPDLTGQLGAAAMFEVDAADVPLVKLMRHCEDNALTCSIAVEAGGKRGEIQYRAGEITSVSFGGVRDDDRIVDIMELPAARLRVTALPLDLDIQGWPSVRREPTAPFRIVGPDAQPGALPPELAEAPPARRTLLGVPPVTANAATARATGRGPAARPQASAPASGGPKTASGAAPASVATGTESQPALKGYAPLMRPSRASHPPPVVRHVPARTNRDAAAAAAARNDDDLRPHTDPPATRVLMWLAAGAIFTLAGLCLLLVIAHLLLDGTVYTF
jgi:hypothetical protein